MAFPLFEFAFVSAFPERLKVLASLAHPENWEYRHSKSDQPVPILYNYVQYTFIRLKEEGKIATAPQTDKACFNTGLVTSNYEEIYAYFIPHLNPQPGGQQWYLAKFCKESDRDLLSFGKLPAMARYINNVTDLLYDTSLELRKNVDHIIDDNRERFPEPFRSMNDNFQLRIALEGALDHSIKRVERNYKTAVPQYYQGHMQLLLPLCMTSPTKADLALAVYREGDVYLAATCLTLDMAYNNARLIARPDTEWLEP